MTAPRRQHGRDVAKLAKSCTNKYRYADEFAARAIAQEMCQQGKAQKGAMWVYECEACRGWHVTSTRNPNRWRVTADVLFDPAATDFFSHLVNE